MWKENGKNLGITILIKSQLITSRPRFIRTSPKFEVCVYIYLRSDQVVVAIGSSGMAKVPTW